MTDADHPPDVRSPTPPSVSRGTPGGLTTPRTRDWVLRAIVGTASVLGVGYLALYLLWGAGPVLAELPWFNALIYVCHFLAAAVVAFLAWGRHQVLPGPVASWIGRGFTGYSILVVFYLLTWPGLLPAGLLAPHPESAAWLLMVAWSVLAGCLLAAVGGPNRAFEEPQGSVERGRGGLVRWGGAVTLAGGLLVVGDRWLPVLVTPTGAWTGPAVAWEAVLVLAYAVGVVRSTRYYRAAGDTLPGYVALSQLVLAFGIGGMVLGGKRYDLWWYLARVLGVGGFLAMVAGFLAEYVTLFRREQERTRAAHAHAAALAQAEAALRQVNATLEAQVDERTTALRTAVAELQVLARFPAENPHPVLRVLRDGTLVYANRASEPLLQLWGCRVGQPLPPDWCTRVTAAYAQGPAEEVEVRCAEGRVYACTLTPILEAGYLNLYLRDITQRKQAEEALRTAHAELEERVAVRTAELSRTLQRVSIQAEQLRSLASELTLVEQRERVRLAEVIHDGLQQLLVAAKLRVTLLGRTADPVVREGCQDLDRLLEDALAAARSLTAELSPPILRTGGLRAGLAWLAHWSQEKHHLTVHVQAPAAPGPPLPEDLTVLLFQSVRELLFNAVKYAHVAAATVTVAWDGSGLTVMVADAGVGFDPTVLRGEGGVAGGFGLARIRHRLELLGGCMTVASAPGQGTQVTLAVRLPRADHATALLAP